MGQIAAADLGALFQIGRLLDTPSNLPRVDNGYTGCLEMARIPGHNRHAMNERSGCDESIPIGARIWHIERGASLGHNGIDSQNSPGEKHDHRSRRAGSRLASGGVVRREGFLLVLELLAPRAKAGRTLP